MSKDIIKGKGHGYVSSDNKICMIRCFECGTENYAMAVSSGYCAFCGHDANSKKKKPRPETGLSKNQNLATKIT